MNLKVRSMEKKIILDLCGGTGSWSNPYKENGYDVRIITLPFMNVLKFKPPKNVYGILAAPPCKEFSLARTTGKRPRNLKEGFEVVRACLEIIYESRLKGNLKFWELENPVGYLRQFLGKPPLTFNPCDYGDSYKKKTDLWGYYNMPKIKKIKLTNEEEKRCKINNRILPELPEGYVPFDGNYQAARRAITPKGFAEAFFKENR
jgi:hypothetical protein